MAVKKKANSSSKKAAKTAPKVTKKPVAKKTNKKVAAPKKAVKKVVKKAVAKKVIKKATPKKAVAKKYLLVTKFKIAFINTTLFTIYFFTSITLIAAPPPLANFTFTLLSLVNVCEII